MPHAVPSSSSNLTGEKSSRTLDHSGGEFCIFLFAQLFMEIATPNLPSAATPPPINYKLHAPCHALQGHQSKRKIRSRTIDHSSGEFFNFFICLTIQMKMAAPNLISSATPLDHELQSSLPRTPSQSISLTEWEDGFVS
jgi:hypothetical protein